MYVIKELSNAKYEVAHESRLVLNDVFKDVSFVMMSDAALSHLCISISPPETSAMALLLGCILVFTSSFTKLARLSK